MELRFRNGSVMKFPEAKAVEGLRGARSWEAACTAAGVRPEELEEERRAGWVRQLKSGLGEPIPKCKG